MENFRGDYQGLANLVQRSWGENSQQGLSYSADFLESFLTSPGASVSLAPAVYQDDALLGFASGFPRHLTVQGHSLRVITSSFLSVLPEYKKFGFGIALWTELVKRARGFGFDGMLNFCVDGEPMNRMVEGASQRLGLLVQRIFSVRYMSSLLKVADFAATAGLTSSVSVEQYLELAASLASSQPLARKWSAPEAEWQLHRSGAVVAFGESESRRGILTGYILPILDAQRTKVLLLEDIFWHELQPEERLQLLRQFLAQAVSQGAQMATVPVLGYADLTAFKKFRFFPTRRVLHCYLTLFRNDLVLEALPSMYLDVF
ncbi:MAG: GNAT family N-acetyltransferase [Candidatus Acidiferrum sp.]